MAREKGHCACAHILEAIREDIVLCSIRAILLRIARRSLKSGADTIGLACQVITLVTSLR
jgi:hypothetical protein